jgi:hypothetical protein
MDFIEQLIDDHCRGVSDFSTAIWALLMFESFLSNVHLGANTSSVQRATGT